MQPSQPSATPVHPSMKSSALTNGATTAVAAAASYWDEHNNLNNKERTPLVEAANLIAALDTAYADMNSRAATAAREVEGTPPGSTFFRWSNTSDAANKYTLSKKSGTSQC